MLRPLGRSPYVKFVPQKIAIGLATDQLQTNLPQKHLAELCRLVCGLVDSASGFPLR
ncbi:MAG TPA: hypothetical protein V6C63_20475 [Allocoleopsis sp.]